MSIKVSIFIVILYHNDNTCISIIIEITLFGIKENKIWWQKQWWQSIGGKSNDEKSIDDKSNEYKSNDNSMSEAQG